MNSRHSPISCRRRCGSFAGATVIRSLPAAALLLIAIGACDNNSGTGGGASARIDYIDGASEPILVRGQQIVIEGFGFGAVRGSGQVSIGSVDATPPDSAWTPFLITATVPNSSPTGTTTLTVVTATGRQISAPVHVLARHTFDPATLTWQSRSLFPRAPAGIALAAGEFPENGTLRATIYAAGGAEPFAASGGLQMVPDSGVYVARVVNGGAGTIEPWIRQRDTSDATRSRVLPAPRAFAAAVVATRYNSRIAGSALYVIGGINAAGQAQASVIGADITPDSVNRRFVFLEPLPTPLAGAIAVVRRGRIYVMGGTDALGRPQRTVYMGRIGADGHIDGWYAEPQLPAARAYGGGVVRDERLVAIGGVADSVPPGGGFGAGTQRLVTGDTAAVSLASGFFTGPWGTGPALLPEGRSQFALLDLGTTLLIVGGMYAGAPSNAAETMAATVSGDSVGPFAGPVGTNTIAAQTCATLAAGTLVGPSGVTWREADGTVRGMVVGGIDLATQLRRSCAWGF
jgi:hypothetical protein